jgi:fatty-acyl-CoA synthase
MPTPAPIALGHWMAQRAERSPLRPALTYEGNTWTYGEFAARIDRLASALRAGGLQAGDRVAFLDLNHPQFFVAMFAAARIGAIFVPLNFRLAAAEIEFIVGDAGAHTLIAGPGHKALIDGVRGQLPCQRYLALDAGGDGWESLDAASAAAPPLADPLCGTADDVAVIMYTSGTTGRPKGAMLTHGNIWWNNVNALLAIDVAADDVHLNFAPLFHIGGLNVLTIANFMKGAHVVLHRSFDPGLVIHDVPGYKVTTSFAVPAMLLMISQHPDFAAADMSTVRVIAVGGAPVPEGLLRLYDQRGIPVHQGYGLTETAPIVSFLTPEFCKDKLGSAGKPPLLTEVRLIDGQGRVLTQPQARGEVCTRGPNVMKGYWNRPEATREVLDDDGWFRTGDVGYFDADGFLFICDRVKDMVITGGENVYPAEVESVLFEHPSIAEVAVVGLPDEKWGETVVAVAALKPGRTLTLEELQAFATERLARYKVPRRLQLVEALPRNPTGKVLKYQLREKLG